jgi:hypothetical protein
MEIANYLTYWDMAKSFTVQAQMMLILSAILWQIQDTEKVINMT